METTPCFRGWKIVRQIGHGHFGAVYEIIKESSGAHSEYSAMKVIPVPSPDGGLEALQAECDNATVTTLLRSQVDGITKEIELMSKLQGNSNIVNYHDYEIIPQDGGVGWYFLIRMELLTSLSDYSNKKSMDEQEIIKLAVHMCLALEKCEQHNILHRDIKPPNIFVNKDGDFKLGDFGVARIAEDMRVTTMAGTYNYMAPEVFNHKAYDKRADIYSLGLVLYWLLNEHRGPFLPLPPSTFKSEDLNEAWRRRMEGEPLPRPAHGSGWLQDVVLKACAFKPEERYQSAEELYDALTGTIGGPGVVLPPPLPPQPQPPRRSKLPLYIAAACAVLLLIVGIVGYLNCWFGHRFDKAWSMDADSHWHASTCQHSDVTAEKATHSWDSGTETTAATHESTGIKTYTCTVCGQRREETIAKITTHTYNQEVVNKKYLKSEATCTAPAEYYKSCICGEAGTETFSYGEATGHTWVDATCTTPKTCSICHATEGSAQGHTWVDATCTTPRTCSVCKATEGSAKGHNWVEATYTTPKTCSVCGATEGEKKATVPIYRLYNADTEEHIYATKESLKELESSGWYVECVAWSAPQEGTPVYQMCNPENGDHFYTITQNEIDTLEKLGWTVDGILTYSADSGVPVYRLYDPERTAFNRMYTTSQSEVDLLVKQGWTLEVIAWYAVE